MRSWVLRCHKRIQQNRTPREEKKVTWKKKKTIIGGGGFVPLKPQWIGTAGSCHEQIGTDREKSLTKLENTKLAVRWGYLEVGGV